MAQIDANQFHAGLKVVMDNQPYAIVANQFVKPGKGQAFSRTRLKHLITGRVIEKNFKSGEKLEIADVIETKKRLLYTEPEGAVFMDDTSFEQINIPSERIDHVKQWLIDDLIYDIVFYNGEPITVEPPNFISMKITETDPGVRGDTASGKVLKPAITESGAKIQVPIFINQGETIKVDTRTGEYVSRDKK